MTREIQLQKELVEAIQSAYLENKFYEVKQNCDALKQLGELPNYIIKIIDKADTAIKEAESLLKQADSFLEEGYPNKAREYYEKARQIVKDHPEVETGLEKCRTQISEAEDCLEKIKKAVEEEAFEEALKLKAELESLNRDLGVEADHLLQDYQILKKEKKKKTLLIGLIAGLVVLGLVVVIATYFSSVQKIHDKTAYMNLTKLAEKTKDPRKRLILYKNFLNKYPKSQFVPAVRQKLHQLPRIIDRTDFQKALAEEKKAGDNLEKAKIALERYLKIHPHGKYKKEIRKSLQRLHERMDERSYQQALVACDKAGENYEECQKHLESYLKKYPKGRYKEEVEKKLASIPDLIFGRSVKEIEKKEQEGKFKKALFLIERLRERFGNDPAKRAKLDEIEKRCFDALDKQDFELAKKKAEEAGDDFDKAEAAYREYIGQHPEGSYVLSAREALQEIEKRRIEQKKKLAQLEAQKKDDATWKQLRNMASQTKSIPRALQIISRYLVKYPKGRHVKEAKQQIVALHKKWFREKAPIKDRLNSRVVTLKGGTKVEGITEFDGNYYYVKGKTSSYVLSKTNVISVEYSEESRKAVEYNKLVNRTNVNSVSSLKKLARWCEKNGFKDKALLIYELIAYINPRDRKARSVMESLGYTYRNGLWVK